MEGRDEHPAVDVGSSHQHLHQFSFREKPGLVKRGAEGLGKASHVVGQRGDPGCAVVVVDLREHD